jgi:predicted nucleotidyltransferase
MSVPWAITSEKMRDAVQRVIKVVRPRKVILFGSAVRGETTIHSDLDILVVTHEEVESPRRESVRIRRALRGILMPMDILVISEKRLEELADLPGLIYRDALRQGMVVYDANR